MKRQLTLLLCGLALASATQAEVLSPEQALKRLDTERLAGRTTRGEVPQTPVYTGLASDGRATLYVFDNPGDSGYLLVSADDQAAPLLGYSDSGTFDVASIPEEMKWWLGEYGRQIEWARANGGGVYSVTRSDDKAAVAPLLKTRWNQGSPYNNLLPAVNGQRCVTGCVATAVAQVMKYWNYPAKGTGTATIKNPATGNAEILALDAQSFAWNDMLDTYNRGQYTDAQANAVAYIMKAVGYASAMEYGVDESSAYAYKAGIALVNNFGYNPQLQYCDRINYLASDWENMIYGEVAAGRPVLYGGQSTSGGHQFVCDGYSSDGYFHFNWGWGGMSDGYFLLNSLNPDALGTGGGLGGGFNYYQEAIVGIQPKDENVDVANLVQYGALKVTDSGLKLDIKLVREDGTVTKWFNTGFTDLSMQVALAVQPVSGGAIQYLDIAKGNVKKPELIDDEQGFGMGLYGIDGKATVSVPSSLADGRYKATVVTKQETGGEWKPVLTLPQYYNYFYFTKSGGKISNIDVLSEATVTLDAIELLTPLYYNCMAKFRITATNNAEKEMTKGFYPDLYKGDKCQMMGDGIMLTIPPKTTVTTEFTTEFRLLQGVSAPTASTSYTIVMGDPNDETVYDLVKTVKMEVATGTPDFSITSFVIPETSTRPENVNGRTVNVYQVEGEEVKFDINLLNKGAYFGYPVVIAIFNTGVTGQLTSIAMSQFGPLTVLGQNESADLTATLEVGDLERDFVYMGVLYYYPGSSAQEVKSASYVYFRLVDGAGVGEISTDEDAPVKYFNMQGVEVINPEKGMLLIKKQGTKTEKIIF